MTREELNELLADLRAAGVQEYHESGDEGSVRIVMSPVAALPTVTPAAAAEERMPRPKRTADERLFGPLGIDDKGGG